MQIFIEQIIRNANQKKIEIDLMAKLKYKNLLLPIPIKVSTIKVSTNKVKINLIRRIVLKTIFYNKLSLF